MSYEYNKDWMIREIARRCHFTLKDVRMIINTLQEIVEEIVILRGVLFWSDMFRMSITRKKNFKGYDPYNKVPIEVKDGFRIKMTPSTKLARLCGEGIAGVYDEPPEEIDKEEIE